MSTPNVVVLPPTQYPTTREVTLKVLVGISTPEDYNYFFDDKGEPQLGLVADVMDALDYIRGHIININGKTYADLQRAMQENIVP